MFVIFKAYFRSFFNFNSFILLVWNKWHISNLYENDSKDEKVKEGQWRNISAQIEQHKY